jgi:cell division initiation protein
MALTPADIEKKTFSTALRGYDLDEVDDFLDEVVVALKAMETDLTEARARVAELEKDPGAPPTAVPPPPQPVPAAAPTVDESAVGRALIAAQQAADRIMDDARTDADRTLKESRSEAEQILESARSEADTFNRERDEKKAEVEAEMAQMTSLVAGVRTKLAVLATTVADKLDEMDAVVTGAEVSGDDEAIVEGDVDEPVLDAAVDEEIAPEAVDDTQVGEDDGQAAEDGIDAMDDNAAGDEGAADEDAVAEDQDAGDEGAAEDDVADVDVTEEDADAADDVSPGSAEIEGLDETADGEGHEV